MDDKVLTAGVLLEKGGKNEPKRPPGSLNQIFKKLL
jgi:hypothetical protein